MDPFSVLGAAQCAIGVLTTCYNIYERIQGADEKIDDAGTEIETNLSFLKEHFSKPRPELSPETLKRVNTRLKNIEEAAKDAADIFELWEAHNSKWLYKKAFQAGPFPGRLEDLSDKIEKNIERLRREFSGLAGTNNHTAVTDGAPPSKPTGIPPSVGFQPILSSRPNDPYTVSGNFNNPISLLSSPAPPSTSAPGWSGMSGHAQPLNPLAHPFTMNSNVQLNNQQPPSSYSRPPLYHSSSTVPLMPPHQQQIAPSQNAPPPSNQHQQVGNFSSYAQYSAQPGVSPTQSIPPNGSNSLYSSGNVNGYTTAQPPQSYGVPVPSVHVVNLAPARPATSQPSQGTSHNSSNIPGQPQNYQNQPPRRPSHLGNPPTQPCDQPQASHGTGQSIHVPPPMQRPQASQTAHLQIPNNAQWAAAGTQTSNQPQVPVIRHISAPGNRPQGVQKPQIQMANNAQQGGFAQPSNQHQVPRTGYVPAPPAVKQSQGPHTAQFSNNAQLGGSSAQPARPPQVPGAGHMSAPPVLKPPPGPQRMQLPNQNSTVGNPIQPAHRVGVIRPTTQMPHAPVPTRTQVPQQKQFSNLAPSAQGPIRPSVTGPIRPSVTGPIRPPGQGPIHPQTSHLLPNSGVPGVLQHHTGPAAYVSGGVSNIPNTSTQSSLWAQHDPTGRIGNTNHAPGHLPSAIVGGTGVQHQNNFPGMPGNGLQPGFQ